MTDDAQTPEAEIAALRADPRPTLRATSPGMEARLYTPIPVLDHGHIRVIDYMGDDAAIVQAARVSYGKGTKSVSNDEGLIRYLMRHWHSTPFEMCEVKLHREAPRFVRSPASGSGTATGQPVQRIYSAPANSILDASSTFPPPEHLARAVEREQQGRGEVAGGRGGRRRVSCWLLNRPTPLRGLRPLRGMLSTDGRRPPGRNWAP